MLMKKGAIFVFIFLILGVSVFVSAFSFQDLFKPTGKVAWEITEPTGICVGAIGNNNDGLFSFTQKCVGYSSKSTCEAVSISNCDPSKPDCPNPPTYPCEWELSYTTVMNNPLHVNQGWNLLFGLIYPSQISNGLNPNTVKAIYNFNPLAKNYNSYWTTDDGPAGPTSPQDFAALQGYHLSSLSNSLNWVYFNESGDIKYRFLNGYITRGMPNEFLTAGMYMIKGWNFLPIVPIFFNNITYDGIVPNTNKGSFTLNSIIGNCDITKAYFFGGDFTNNPEISNQIWTEVMINDPIGDENLFRVMAVNVSSDCIIGKTNHKNICTDTDGGIRFNIKGSVKITGSSGNIIDTQNDSCGNIYANQEGLEEKYCQYNDVGDVSIGALPFGIGGNSSLGANCVDGAII